MLFKQAEKNDVEADATCNVTAMEESVGQAEAASKSDGVASKIDFEKHSSDPRADAPAVSKMVEVHIVIKFLYIYIYISIALELLNIFVHLGRGQPNYP